MSKATSAMTPGPWVDDDSRKVYSKRVIRMNGVIVATMPSDGSMMPLEEKDANARAIAALPELVEAAHAVLNFRNDFTIAELRRILARIEGEA